ncbi:MAG: ABC transporter permease [Trueperaceae bacterium]|nr:ABC transporter permease [Trueperaceae bacterium]
MIRRILMAVPILLGVVLVVLLTMEIVPGDPVALMLGEFATPEAIQSTRNELGLNQPLHVRYVQYIADVVRGDLGTSIKDGRPVAVMIGETLPATAQLAGAAVLLAVFVGVPLGVASAARPQSWVDNLVRVVSLAGLSMPVFWTGLVFIVVFSVNLGWFPVAGRGSFRHLVLPAVTLALPSVAILARMTRASLLEVLQEDYVRTARSKGVSRRSMLYKHALRNAIIPVVTALGLQLGQMLGGAVLTETVFSWPGLGRLTVFAIFNRDFILVQGVVLVLATTYVSVNLLVDVSYGLFDPRVSYS